MHCPACRTPRTSSIDRTCYWGSFQTIQYFLRVRSRFRFETPCPSRQLPASCVLKTGGVQKMGLSRGRTDDRHCNFEAFFNVRSTERKLFVFPPPPTPSASQKAKDDHPEDALEPLLPSTVTKKAHALFLEADRESVSLWRN